MLTITTNYIEKKGYISYTHTHTQIYVCVTVQKDFLLNFVSDDALFFAIMNRIPSHLAMKIGNYVINYYKWKLHASIHCHYFVEQTQTFQLIHHSEILLAKIKLSHYNRHSLRFLKYLSIVRVQQSFRSKMQYF